MRSTLSWLRVLNLYVYLLGYLVHVLVNSGPSTKGEGCRYGLMNIATWELQNKTVAKVHLHSKVSSKKCALI